MSAYGSARALAKHLGHDEVVGLLQKTLDEEAAADEKLTAICAEEVLPQVESVAEVVESWQLPYLTTREFTRFKWRPWLWRWFLTTDQDLVAHIWEALVDHNDDWGSGIGESSPQTIFNPQDEKIAA
jgi:Domain of unknown function (DUF892)